MLTKILFTSELELLTGLHIGGSNEFNAIGAVDSMVVRDSITKLPYIPGSSLKGKMRYLLAKHMNGGVLTNEPNKDKIDVIRLFGNSAAPIIRARLKFNDCFMQNAMDLQKRRVAPTEIKFENTIDRGTSVANPRQIERVIRGGIFKVELFYEVDKECDDENVINDFECMKTTFKLLEYDYLGGHGTRGSGRVKFNNFKAKIMMGEFKRIDEINAIFGDVNA